MNERDKGELLLKGDVFESRRELQRLQVISPALLHSITHSSVVLTLVFAVHQSGFRVCIRIRIRVTEQRLWIPKKRVTFKALRAY